MQTSGWLLTGRTPLTSERQYSSRGWWKDVDHRHHSLNGAASALEHAHKDEARCRPERGGGLAPDLILGTMKQHPSNICSDHCTKPPPKIRTGPKLRTPPKNKNHLGLSTKRAKNKNHLGHKQTKSGEHCRFFWCISYLRK